MYSSITMKFLRYLAYANFWLAIGAGLSVWMLYLVVNSPINILAILSLFFVTFSIYNLNRHAENELDIINHPGRVAFIRRYSKYLFPVALVSYLITILLSLIKSIEIFLLLLFPLVVVILYTANWVPNSLNLGFRRFKDIFIFKDVIVAFTWATTITFVGALYQSFAINNLILLFWSFLFLRFLVNVIVFDLRDIEGDSRQKVKTIPVVLGKKKTRKLLYLLNASIVFSFSYVTFMGLMPPVMHIINLVSGLYTHLYISYTKNNDINYLCDVVVDGEYTVMWIAALIGTFILA